MAFRPRTLIERDIAIACEEVEIAQADLATAQEEFEALQAELAETPKDIDEELWYARRDLRQIDLFATAVAAE